MHTQESSAPPRSAPTAASAPAPVPASMSSARLPSLTGMRFFAAVAVFVTHVAVVAPFTDESLNHAFWKYLSRAGYLGVGFFFVLSGFVLAWSSRTGDTPGRFIRRRLAKIYPNHLVTWAAGLLLMLATGAHVWLGNTLPSLLLVQSWVPDLKIMAGPNGPSWSLVCELLFYLAFPFLIKPIRRIRPERLWLAVGVVVAAFWAVPLLAQLLPDGPPAPDQPVSWWKYWFVYFCPGTRLLDFVLGILMARIVLAGRWIGLRRLPALALLAAGYALMVFLPDAYGLVAPTALPVALVIAASAVADVKNKRSVLAGRFPVWLGEVSFAFYMVHFLVLYYGPMRLATADPRTGRHWDTPQALGLMALSLALSLLLGWLLHVLVEQPAMRRWSKSKADRAAAASAQDRRAAAPTTDSAVNDPIFTGTSSK
ncbi:acyltransferase family protein [Streptomyces sp. NPDC021093]|uniref:acyltransferase family protein n=1 Tax=Streptomyces sp. NPDC021093 TaxID=3365112 RepID=UPI0037B9C3DE